MRTSAKCGAAGKAGQGFSNFVIARVGCGGWGWGRGRGVGARE